MSKKLVLFKDEANVKLVHIRFPPNCHAMKDRKYTFHHTYMDCKNPCKDRCPFPHDKVEQVFWNAWKDEYFSNNSLGVVAEPPTVSWQIIAHIVVIDLTLIDCFITIDICCATSTLQFHTINSIFIVFTITTPFISWFLDLAIWWVFSCRTKI